MTESSLKININTLNALASFAILTTSKYIIAKPIINEVVKIAETGVMNLELTEAKKLGIKLSFAIAKGNLEDARIPEFAIDNKVITPTAPATYPKVFPPIDSNSVCIGLISVDKIEASMFPTKTKATKT